MRIENLQKLFLEQLKDAYDFEHQLVDALQEMEKGASSTQLKRAFAEHRKQTERQAKRLERVFSSLGEKPERKTCKGMKGLIAEGREILEAKGDEAALDAGLIGAAQKVEHYEMATYGTLRTFAQQLGREQEARLLQEILDEESQANEKLTGLATQGINREAESGKTRESSGLQDVLGSLGIGGRGKSPGKSTSTGSSSRKTSTRKADGTAKSRSSAAKGSNGTSRKAASRKNTTASRGASNGEVTKEQLMEQARELDIEGRSQMNKAQLQRAVQRRH